MINSSGVRSQFSLVKEDGGFREQANWITPGTAATIVEPVIRPHYISAATWNPGGDRRICHPCAAAVTAGIPVAAVAPAVAARDGALPPIPSSPIAVAGEYSLWMAQGPWFRVVFDNAPSAVAVPYPAA